MSDNTTPRKFPRLRNLIKSIMRPDMYAIREFTTKEAEWMRGIIEEQTKVILDLQQVIVTYNDQVLQVVERSHELQLSINKVIEEKQDAAAAREQHMALLEELQSLKGMIAGMGTSLSNNTALVIDLGTRVTALEKK